MGHFSPLSICNILPCAMWGRQPVHTDAMWVAYAGARSCQIVPETLVPKHFRFVYRLPTDRETSIQIVVYVFLLKFISLIFFQVLRPCDDSLRIQTWVFRWAFIIYIRAHTHLQKKGVIENLRSPMTLPR